MWWFMAAAFAGSFDGAWQVTQVVPVGAACAPMPRFDEAIVIQGAGMRFGAVELGGTIDGESLFAAGVAGHPPSMMRWELHPKGDSLVGTVRVEAACVSSLAVVLGPFVARAPVESPPPPAAPPVAPPPPMTSEFWWTVEPAITFLSGKADLAPESAAGLEAVAEKIRARPDGVIEIAVHSDSMGSDVFNLKLSQARADEVRTWLVLNLIPASRLVAVGYGEVYPIAPNTTVEGKATNRRVELRLAK